MTLLENLQMLFFKDMDLMSLAIIAAFLSFLLMFWRAQVTGRIDWLDLIRKPTGESVSLTKLTQLIGGIVATWIMVKLTMTDKMSWDIFAIYLAYAGSIEGYSKFITAKYGISQPTKSKEKE